MNYIYIMHTSLFFYKIGVSKRPQQRRKQIERSEGRSIRLVFVLPMPRAYAVEGVLHKLYKPLKVGTMKGSGKSEWFFFVLPVTPILLLLMTFLLFASFVLGIAASTIVGIYTIASL